MGIPDPGRNRRRYERVAAAGPVRFTGDRTSSAGEILNVSVQGMMLKSWNLPEADEAVRLTFRLPRGDHEFTLQGVVVWAVSRNDFKELKGVGVRFTDVPPEDESRLQEYVDLMLGQEEERS